MKKTIYRRGGNQWCALELTLENGRLSITGMEGHVSQQCVSRDVVKREKGDAYVMESCGQITDTLKTWFPEVAPYLQWHLNDMRAGCEHQETAGWQDRPIDPSKPTNAYGVHFPGQHSASWNMLAWVRPDEHPAGLLGAPCPTCGYKYGSAWTKRELPADVIAWVESFEG